jgi:hypothetical protein
MVMLAVAMYSCAAIAAQIDIPRIESMPNMPAPYQMRDWKQVARDYDNYIFSFTRTASSSDSWWEKYPIVWWDTGRVNYPWDTFGMPSYIGHPSMHGGGTHEAINCLGAVLGGALAGIDKSNQFVAVTGQYKPLFEFSSETNLDCLATDYFHSKAYPTYLYYNPHSEKKTVNIDLGAEHKSIYDAVENKFLVTNAAGIQSFSIEPNSAVLAVLTPASGNIKYDGKKTLINGVVVDYIKGK